MNSILSLAMAMGSPRGCMSTCDLRKLSREPICYSALDSTCRSRSASSPRASHGNVSLAKPVLSPHRSRFLMMLMVHENAGMLLVDLEVATG
jgi:hypothetical protein